MKRLLFFSIILLFQFNILVAQENLIPIVDDYAVGFIDNKGTVIIPPQYHNKVNYILFNKNGKNFVDFDLPYWSNYSEGKVTVIHTFKFLFIPIFDRFTVIDNKGNELFEKTNDFIGLFKDSLAIYEKGEYSFLYKYGSEWGFINTKGEFVISPQYNYLATFQDELALARKSDKYIFINKKGDVVLESKYEDVRSFSEGLAPIMINEKWGFMDKNGKEKIKPQFDYVWGFQNGAARVLDGNYYGYIDFNGNFIKMPVYQFALDFSEGLGCINDNGKWGYINISGEFERIPFFEDAGQFSEGLAAVAINGKYGFINKQYDFVIQPIFDFASKFVNGLAKVWKNNEVYYINTKGEIIWTILDKEKVNDIINELTKIR